MKSELDEILDSLPQCEDNRDGLARGFEALVYTDAAGRLCILIDNVGFLALDDRNTSYLKADVDPFPGDGF